MLAMKGDGVNMPEDTLRMVAAELRRHVQTCERSNIETAAAMRELQAGHVKLSGKIDAFEQAPMKAARFIGGIVFTAVVTMTVQNWYLHEQNVAAASQAAQAAQSASVAARQTTAISQALGVPQVRPQP